MAFEIIENDDFLCSDEDTIEEWRTKYNELIHSIDILVAELQCIPQVCQPKWYGFTGEDNGG